MSASLDKGDIIQSFMAITSESSIENATYLLEAANYSIDDAVNLFFSQDNSSSSIPAVNPVHRDFFDEEMLVDNFEDEVIRKPDIVKKQRLMDTQHDYFDFQAKKNAMLKNVPVSTFACATDCSVSDKDRTLAKLYQPPYELMTQGFLADVRERCKSEGKWLLVNIQREEDFDCHLANRDFWSDETIKEIITCGFLFWQVQNVSLEGSNFCKNYRITEFPHIAVIDPRTGASIWVYSKKINPEIFSESLMDFLGSHPYPEGNSSSSAKQSTHTHANTNANTVSLQSSATTSTTSSTKNVDIDLTSTSTSKLNEEYKTSKQKNEIKSGNSIMPDSGPNSTLLSEGVVGLNATQGKGFDPNELCLVNDLKKTSSPSDGIPVVRILFKIPPATEKLNTSFSLPLNTTVAALASYAASVIDSTSGTRNFELLLLFPRKMLSTCVKENPNVTLLEIGITTDTLIIIQFV